MSINISRFVTVYVVQCKIKHLLCKLSSQVCRLSSSSSWTLVDYKMLLPAFEDGDDSKCARLTWLVASSSFPVTASFTIIRIQTQRNKERGEKGSESERPKRRRPRARTGDKCCRLLLKFEIKEMFVHSDSRGRSKR